MSRSYDAGIKSYKTANEFLNKGQKKNLRKIGNNTYLVRNEDKSISVTYHTHTIIIYYPNKTMMISSCGWKTCTTKERLNKLLPVDIYQNKHIWYVANKYNPLTDHVNKYSTHPRVDVKTNPVFYDGMIITNAGKVKGKKIDTKKVLDEHKKLEKDIKEYVDGFMTALHEGKINKPDSGDCFFCSMRENKTNQPLGECIHDVDHLDLHMKQKYYVPSLLMNAIQMYGVSIMAKEYIRIKMTDEEVPGHIGFPVDQVKSALTRYIRHCYDGAKK